MVDEPPDLQKQFTECLLRNAIPTEEYGAYEKWLGRYLEFCQKYEVAVESQEGFVSFIAMLVEKNMADGLQRQAARAIGLFLKYPNEVFSSLGIPEAAQSPGSYSSSSLKEFEAKEQVLSSTFVPAQQIIDGQRLSHLVSMATSFGNLCPQTFHPQETSPVHGIPPVARTVSPLTLIGALEASWEKEYSCLNDELRTRHYSLKTLKTYRNYVRKFQTFTRSIDPRFLSSAHVKEFLDDLADGKKVSATTQNIAFNSLLFFYRHVLGKEFGRVEGVVRAKRRQIIPVVLTREEIGCILGHIELPLVLVVKLLYGCGLKLSECLNLRVHSINFAAGLLTIHDTKGREDRKVPLPQTIMSELQGQVEIVRQLHIHDLDNGYAGVFEVDALEKKPKNAARELSWQWLFPAMQLTREEGTGDMRRYHLHETHVQKAIKRAVKASGIGKKATAHTFRHSYASHLLQNNYDIHTIQELLGHGDVRTTMIYTRTVKSRTLKEARSPLDF